MLKPRKSEHCFKKGFVLMLAKISGYFLGELDRLNPPQQIRDELNNFHPALVEYAISHFKKYSSNFPTKFESNENRLRYILSICHSNQQKLDDLIAKYSSPIVELAINCKLKYQLEKGHEIRHFIGYLERIIHKDILPANPSLIRKVPRPDEDKKTNDLSYNPSFDSAPTSSFMHIALTGKDEEAKKRKEAAETLYRDAIKKPHIQQLLKEKGVEAFPKEYRYIAEEWLANQGAE